MAEDVADIEVAVNAAGTEQTRTEIEQTSDQLEEATGQMQDSADEMGGLQRRMQGLGMALAGTLAAASAGVLTQVPVIGSAIEGLKGVFQGLAFQVDQLLRDIGANGLTGGLFDLSEAIFEAEGPLGQLAGAFTLLAAVVAPIAVLFGGIPALIAGVAAGAVLLAGKLGILQPIVKTVLNVMSSLVGAFTDAISRGDGLIDTIGILLSNLASLAVDGIKAVVSAFGDLASAIADILKDTDWNQLGKDVVDGIIKGVGIAVDASIKGTEIIAGEIYDIVTETDWVQLGKDILKGIAKGLGFLAEFLTGAAEAVAEEVTDAITDVDWSQKGKNILKGIAEGIRNAGSIIKDAIKDAAGKLDKFLPDSPAEEGPLSDLDETGPALVETFAKGIEQNTGRLEQAGDSVGSAANPSGDSFFAGNSAPTVSPQMDGRDLTERTGRYRRAGTARRNRNG